MHKDDLNKLHALLGEWFEEYDLNKRETLNKNKVARRLKKELNKVGRWKNLPRGLPNIENFK